MALRSSASRPLGELRSPWRPEGRRYRDHPLDTACDVRLGLPPIAAWQGNPMTCSQCGGRVHEGVVRVRQSVAVAIFAIGLLLAYTIGGDLLHDLVEGGQRSLLPLWKLWLPLAVLLLGVVASFLHLRRPVCEACGAQGLFEPL